MPQIVRIVFRQTEPPDGTIPRLAQEIGVRQSVVRVPDRQPIDERFKGSGYGYIALAFFPVFNGAYFGGVYLPEWLCSFDLSDVLDVISGRAKFLGMKI
ncbi:hypothetical protein AB0L85_24980 [Streptomyces sp. NPDC052051]|uniref:hypothetical protein n=1 Tax=Streptomyces sp. NPDC052051 TaxID=3154649 RepID=UPI00344506B7